MLSRKKALAPKTPGRGRVVIFTEKIFSKERFSQKAGIYFLQERCMNACSHAMSHTERRGVFGNEGTVF